MPMKRREFIAGLGGTAVMPLAVRAQQSGRVRLVGILMPFPQSDPEMQANVQAFRQEFAKLGWAEGSVQFDEHWTTDNMDLVRAAAANLVESKPDVIFTSGDRVIPIFMQLTRSVPIVAQASDLVGSGFAESLARPGGNITGFSVIEFSVIGKMLETLKHIAPGTSRVGMIYNPDNPVGAIYSRLFNAVARQLAVQSLDLPVHGLAEVERAVESLSEQPNSGFLVPPDVTIGALRAQVPALAARHSIPAVYPNSLYVIRGGLVSYGPDVIDLFRRDASYVDRILRGERPADLPIQQPTKFELVINLKTAKVLGLTIPETLLATADEVIQ
jgi:putative tryptophan/tyrosine transport system substrate-binding protein